MYNLYNLEVNGSSSVFYDIEEIIKKFKSFLLLKTISHGSIRSYLSDVRHFYGWLEFFLKSNDVKIRGGESSPHFPPSPLDPRLTSHPHPVALLEHVNEKVLTAYKTFQTSNNISQKTINRRFSSLRKFGAFSQDQGWLKENAFDTLKNIPEEKKPFPESEYHLEEFKVHLWKSNLSKATLKNYLNDIKQFLSWVDSHRSKADLQ